jgi:2-polyprenyl-6-methoxyphenol hydroxylase-like FAD-dependent oxidoreductase
MMASTSLRVLVIGGGIGGLCLAQALRRTKLEVTVFERNSPHVWPAGYRIHINPVGARALRGCLPDPLWDAFIASSGTPPAGLGFLTEQLDELVVIGERFMAKDASASDAHHYPINRTVLRHLLLAGLGEHIRYGKTFERYTQHADGTVTAHFSDGSLAVGEVLVGADGANSRVRQQYLPHARRVTLGVAGIAGTLPLSPARRAWLPSTLLTRMNLIQAPRDTTLFIAPFEQAPRPPTASDRIQRAAAAAGLAPHILREDGGSYALWALIADATSLPADAARFDGRDLLDHASRRVTGWHPLLRRLIAESDPERVVLNHFKASQPVAPWPSSSVTVLGDAIHNMPPVGGLGGNMALHDAVVLAQQLDAAQRGVLPLHAAIQAYEAELRTAGYAALRSSLRYTRQAAARGRLSRLSARVWFQLCGGIPALRQAFEAEWTRPMRDPAG